MEGRAFFSGNAIIEGITGEEKGRRTAELVANETMTELRHMHSWTHHT